LASSTLVTGTRLSLTIGVSADIDGEPGGLERVLHVVGVTRLAGDLPRASPSSTTSSAPASSAAIISSSSSAPEPVDEDDPTPAELPADRTRLGHRTALLGEMLRMSALVRLRLSVRTSMRSATPPGA
jgi:hypothetical protein